MKKEEKKIVTCKYKNYLPWLVSLVVLVVGYFVYSNVFVKDSITVTGSATHEFTNQIATFSITVEENNADKTKAVEAAEKRASEVVASIKSFGIPDEDIETQNINVYQREEPVYDRNLTKYEPGDWYATYSISITLRNLDKSSELTSLLANLENTTMWGPNLSIDRDEIDETAVLNEAVEDAREKASILAAASNKKVGKVINIIETSSNMYGIAYEKAGSAIGGGGDFPVEVGTTSVTKSVTVTFRLK